MTTYLEFVQKVESLTRMSGNDDVRDRVKILTNDAIIQFCRYSEWRLLYKTFEFTTGKTFDVAAADHSTNNSFSVAGNYIFKFKTGDTITISGSTSNDGDYTVASTPTYGGTNTEIVVTESLTDSTADGTLISSHEDYAFPSDFSSEIKLFDSSGNIVDKRSYSEYKYYSTYVWAPFGNRFYVSGSDSDYELLYITKGSTLSDNDDTSVVIDYYEDILKRWTAYLFWVWYGADETAAKEEMMLKTELQLLKNNENRMAKNGRPFRISVHNRK